MILNEKTYKILKWIALVFLPALTTFVGVCMKCFDISYTDTVLTIMVAFDTFLGALLGVSTSNYYKEVE